MQITVFSGFSKKLNSTAQASGGTSIDVVLKTPTSVMHPQFLISGFDTSWNYIEWDSRYYYVSDITIQNNTQAIYSCDIDVLATFRSEILASSQLVTRNATTYTPLLADNAYPLLNGYSTSKLSLTDLYSGLDTTGMYVVGVISPDADSGVAYYGFTAGGSNFSRFMTYLFSDAWLDADGDISVEIQKELINPFQYIVSCTWYPLSFGSVTETTTIKFGYWDTELTAMLLTESDRVQTIDCTAALPRHPQQTANGIHMNGSPYTRYLLDIWGFGSIPIDPLPFVENSAIGIYVETDVFTGVGRLRVSDSTGSVILTQTAQFGVPIQISQLNQNMINSGLSALSSGMSLVSGAVTGNIVGGVVGAGSGILSAIENAMPQVQTQGTMGSKIAYTTIPSITAMFLSTPTISPARVGRPLMTTVTLSSLSGFTVCDNVALDTTASDEEKRQIIEFMTRGFYIE